MAHAELESSADESLDQQVKQTRRERGRRSRPPPATFWDNLSKVPLTRRALDELQRRIQQADYTNHLTTTFEENRKCTLEQFARQGGPDLCSLRGYPEHLDNEQSSKMGRKAAKKAIGSPTSRGEALGTDERHGSGTKRSSAYDMAFQQHLDDNGIHMGPRGPKPENIAELRGMLSTQRDSLSSSVFSEAKFEDFQQKNADAAFESTVMTSVLPIIYGTSSIPHQENVYFGKLESMTQDTTVCPKPDFYDGIRPEEITKSVREDLKHHIIPSSHTHLPAAPNFFLEAKGPSGGLDVVERQACLDGAIGARGMHDLQNYGLDKTVYDGKAYAVAATYGSGNLRLYTTHPTLSATSERNSDYHMTLVGGWDMMGNAETFRQGATALRNARDWAQEQRHLVVSNANSRAKALRSSEASKTDSSNSISNAPSVHESYLTPKVSVDGGRQSTTAAIQAHNEQSSVFLPDQNRRFSHTPHEDPSPSPEKHFTVLKSDHHRSQVDENPALPLVNSSLPLHDAKEYSTPRGRQFAKRPLSPNLGTEPTVSKRLKVSSSQEASGNTG